MHGSLIQSELHGAALAQAQSSTGAIVGRHFELRNCKHGSTAKNELTGLDWKAIFDSTGEFQSSSLPFDSYSVAMSANNRFLAVP